MWFRRTCAAAIAVVLAGGLLAVLARPTPSAHRRIVAPSTPWGWLVLADEAPADRLLSAMRSADIPDVEGPTGCRTISQQTGARTDLGSGQLRKIAASEDGAWCRSYFLLGAFETWAEKAGRDAVEAALPSMCRDAADVAGCGRGGGRALAAVISGPKSSLFAACNRLLPYAGWDCIYGARGSLLDEHSEADRAELSIGWYCTDVPAAWVAFCEHDVGTAWMRDHPDAGPAAALAACTTTGGERSARRCAHGVGVTLHEVLGSEPDALLKVCEAAPPGLAEPCAAGGLASLHLMHRAERREGLCAAVSERWRDICEINTNAAPEAT